jgi:hypothetical protein
MAVETMEQSGLTKSPEPTAPAPSAYITCGDFGALGLRRSALPNGCGSAHR